MSNTTDVAMQRNIFGYDPNEPLSYAAAAVFGMFFIIVLAQTIRFKTWFFLVVPIASLMELIGFILRPTSAYALGKFIVSTLCILLAPTVYAMADYALISKIMIKTDIHHPIFKPHLVRWIFLGADIASFFIQCTGGGLTAMDDIKVAQTGSKMLLGGLSVALAVFVFFLFMLAYVHYKMWKKSERTSDYAKSSKLIFVLYIDMILLIIRSVYRVAEYGNLQYHNSISTNESLFYGLDALEMALLNVLWIPFHPGFWGFAANTEDKDGKSSEMTVVA